MIKVVYTRPAQWAKLESHVLDKHYARPAAVLRLRDGRKTTDSMGTVFDERGMKGLAKMLAIHRPDIFLFWTHFGEFFDTGKIRKLRRMLPDTVFVHGTGSQVLNKGGRDWYIERIRKIVDVQTTNTTDARRIAVFKKTVGDVRTLHDIAVDPAEFTPPKGKVVWDCFFGGGDGIRENRPKGRFPNSLARHRLVTRASKLWKVKVRGGGWKIPSSIGLLDLAYFREMQKAKIVIGFNHLELESYYTKRTIYGGASGRLLVTKYIPGMRRDGLVDGLNVVWFRTVDEGLEKIAYYLKHDDEREAIAERQRRYFIRHHSWEARLREFERIAVDLILPYGGK